MDQTRWQQIEELLQQALDLEPSKRIAFLTTACDGDADLRLEVENLLRNEDLAFSLIERPAAAYVGTPIIHRRALVIGECISHYQIESLIGTGGMGEVWRATDQHLKRKRCHQNPAAGVLF